MRARFQRGGTPTISFFAFQDIITSVIGILVVITLLLSMHLDQMPLVSSDTEAAPAERVAQLQRALDELSALRAEIDAVSAASAGGPGATVADDV